MPRNYNKKTGSNKPSYNNKGQNNNRRPNGSTKTSSTSGNSFNKFYHDLFNSAGDYGKSSNSFPFANIAGAPLQFQSNRVEGQFHYDTIQLPSIMVLESIITPGFSDSNGSPLNVAANKLFAEMRRYNTSVETYDAVDVMQYILACDTAFAIHSYFASAYMLLHNMDWSNKFIPIALCESRGFDYEDISVHQTEFRDILNNFRIKMGSLNIPNAFPFMAYHARLFSNVYKDADNFRAQLYSVIPHIYYVFQEGEAGNEPGKLVPKAFPTVDEEGNTGNKVRRLTVADMKAILDSIVTPLMTSSLSLISGDMLKLTDYTMLQLDEVTENSVSTPIYDPEFLRDLKNATVYANTKAPEHVTVSTSTYDETTGCYYIEQTSDVGGIKFAPLIKGITCGGEVIIDIDADLPSPEEFYVATRHTTLGSNTIKTFDTDPKDNYRYVYSVCNPDIMGFDYYVRANIYNWDPVHNSAKLTSLGTVAPGVNDLVSKTIGFTTDFVIDLKVSSGAPIASASVEQILYKLATLSKFSVIPRCNLIIRKVRVGSDSNIEYLNVMNDVYNIAAVPPMKLRDATEMTYLAAYSLDKKS